ncbi:MAG: tetratricopeptide repeat protein [Gammaproteobacteria bacterium]|nr:tetratricopeptide repeat protein [Gammaproteobacteria bacterium]
MNYQNIQHAPAGRRNFATLLLTGLLAWSGFGVDTALAASAASPTANYVVNLESSRRGIDPKAVAAAKRLPGQSYILEVDVKGVKWERLRLGFFANEVEAKKAMTRILGTFPQAWITRIDDSEIALASAQQPAAVKSASAAKVPAAKAPTAKEPPAKATTAKAPADGSPFVARTQPAPAQKPVTKQAAQEAPGRYIINLESATGNIDSKALEAARGKGGYSVYLMRATVKGTEWERLRLGFFNSESEARKVMAGMLARFPQAWVAQGGTEDWELAARQQQGQGAPARLPPPESTRVAKAEVPPPAKKTAAIVPEVTPSASSTAKTDAAAAAVVTVAAKPVAEQAAKAAVADPVQVARAEASAPAKSTSTDAPIVAGTASTGTAVSTTAKLAGGAGTLAVVATGSVVDAVAEVPVSEPVQVAATATRTPDSKTAATATDVATTPPITGNGEPVPSKNVKVAAAASAVAAPAPTVSQRDTPASSVDEKASQRMLEARQAMLDQDWDKAVKLLTSVLGSNDTADHMQAREFLGLARERKGQLAHAKAEYERYLEDYPDSEGAARVQQRLVGLVTAGDSPKMARGDSQQDVESDWDMYGSLWQYYYRDVRSIGDEQRVVDALYTNVDTAARYDGERYGIMSRVNGGYRHFLSGVEDGDETYVNLAYLELTDEQIGLSGRVGRQSRHSGGVLGRFDGAFMAYSISPRVTLNGVAGYTVDTSRENFQSERSLYGLSVDLTDLVQDMDFSLFYNAQDYSGATDRRAVGGEMRYFVERGSLLGLVDYDTYYGALNIAMLSGSWSFPGQWVVSANLDYRRSPLITSRNALIGQQTQSMDILLSQVGEEEVRIMAEDRSAEYQSAMFGLSHPLNEKLQIQLHASMFNLSSTESSGGVAGYEGTGNEFAYDMQFIGTSLLAQGDMSIIGMRYVDGNRYSTISMFLNSRFPLAAGFRIQPRVRIDRRSRMFDDLQEWILSPSVRLDYRIGPHALELDLGAEWWRQDGAVTATDASAYFMNLGYRLVF